MNEDLIRSRTWAILVAEKHQGFISFLVENPDDPRCGFGGNHTLWDKCLSQWEALTESEKSGWDIMIVLQGGMLEVLKARGKIGNQQRSNQIGQYERRVLKLILEQRKERSQSLMDNAIGGSEGWSWARADVFAVDNIERYLELKAKQ